MEIGDQALRLRAGWQEMPGRYASPDDARGTATERGIYRVTYFCEGRRCDLEPFALVGR